MPPRSSPATLSAISTLPPRRKHPRSQAQTAQGRPRTSVRVQRAPGGKSYELVHPPCVRERSEDLLEVQAMLAAGEMEVAADELRWLLEDCRDFIEAHKILGELAAAEGDAK